MRVFFFCDFNINFHLIYKNDYITKLSTVFVEKGLIKFQTKIIKY